MTQWTTAPTRIEQLPEAASKEQVIAHVRQITDYLALLAKDLNFIINGNLDVKNIRAQSITADRMKVNELSAISANLGHITAGLIEAVQIFGSYIATSQFYPKVEFSNTENMIIVSQDADHFILFSPLGANPSIQIFDGVLGNNLLLYNQGGLSHIAATNSLEIAVTLGNLLLRATSGLVQVESWSEFYSIGNGQTLQQALDSLSARITALGG